MAGLPVGRALSAVGGALIVIALTLIFGSSLYSYVSGLFSSSTSNISVNVQAQLFANPSSSQGYLEFSISNNGNTKIELTAIKIENTTIAENISLPSGGSYQGIIPLNISIQPGEYYSVVFLGKAESGELFSVVENVLAG